MTRRRAGLLALAAMLQAVPARAQEAVAAPEAAVESTGPRLALRGFSDVNFSAHEEGQPETFALGQFDTFMTSALSDQLSVLAEIVFEFGEDNSAVLDVERVQLRWAPADVFTLTAGRMHTSLGYWNQTFHHGAWLQTTADRPLMYRFEDDGGILPVHMVGVQVAGTWNARLGSLKYSASLANGRGHIPDEIANVQDATDAKAVSLWMGLAPAAAQGLEFGTSVYLDTIPAEGATDDIDERILGGYLVWRRDRLELLAEVSHVRHERAGRHYGTWGLYGQGGLKVGRWTPYYRFDRVQTADDDPFLPPEDLSLHTLGLRRDVASWAALKGEYHLRRPAGGPRIHSARLQAAFTF
jgi:hypothetical protein